MAYQMKPMSHTERQQVFSEMMAELAECGHSEPPVIPATLEFTTREDDDDLLFLNIGEAIDTIRTYLDHNSIAGYRLNCPDCRVAIDVTEEEPIHCNCVCNKAYSLC